MQHNEIGRKYPTICIVIAVFILAGWLRYPSFEVHAVADSVVPIAFDETYWLRSETLSTQAVALGDHDKDGDLDAYIANCHEDRLLFNDHGQHNATPHWTANIDKSFCGHAIAWGDYNQDGDLDFALGTEGGKPLVLFENHSGGFDQTPSWQSADLSFSTGVAWGDVDGDGDLDLAVANKGQSNALYLNNGIILSTTPAWESDEVDESRAVVWHDFDRDGDLDLVVANEGEPNRLYRNNSGTLSKTADWSTDSSDQSYAVDIGDFNRDGFIDLAFGNYGQPNKIYLNQQGTLETMASWKSDESDLTRAIAIADFDGDGYADLFAGNGDVFAGRVNRLYQNMQGSLSATATWTSIEENATYALAAGDIDGNGMVDLLVGNYFHKNTVYRNLNLPMGQIPTWSSTATSRSDAVAWGDVDGDGDLDLAVGNEVGQPDQIYLNQDGMLDETASWQSADTAATQSLAWGDVDGDNDLDLAVGSVGSPVRLYINNNGTLPSSASWTSNSNYVTKAVAWADFDGDGDLDLAVGNEGEKNVIFSNQNGSLTQILSWESAHIDQTTSLAWGDVDNDGDLDLAVGNIGFHNRVYLNQAGVLDTDSSWESTLASNTFAVAWADINYDGNLDLVTINGAQPNQLYLNQDGLLDRDSSWQSAESDNSRGLAVRDIDGDDDLDVIVGSLDKPLRIYRNNHGTLTTSAIWSSQTVSEIADVAVADVDADGDLDIAVANRDTQNWLFENPRDATSQLDRVPLIETIRPISTHRADHFSSPTILATTIVPIHFTLTNFDGQGVHRVRAYYSLNGGGDWRKAILAGTGNNKFDLPLLVATGETITTTHTYAWDAAASGFVGKSDNVVLRLVAIPSVTPTSPHAPHHYQRAATSDTTLPFRMQGVQVRVTENGSPVAGAYVYHLPNNQAHATPLTDSGGELLPTNLQGNLQGRSVLLSGDQIMALRPVSVTQQFSLYYTSAPPTVAGLAMHSVTNADVQTLVVSSDRPLLALNLTVSIEWDASQDSGYLSQLTEDIEETSRLLFDLTNGQAALGDVNIFFNKERWLSADVTIFANNAMRPNVDLGGSIITPTVAILSNGSEIANGYVPGQVRMSSIWNRFGNLGGTTTVDWPRALAHELSHYFFFVPDNYLGLDVNGRLIPTNCAGSVMTDAYRDDYSEFLTAAQWTGDCLQTIAQLTTGKSDWEMLRSRYPFFTPPQDNPGPHTLPLAITTISFNQPENVVATLSNPYLNIVEETGAPLPLPANRVQAYQFVHNGTPLNYMDDRIVPLGVPSGGSLLTRGATTGDRVCIIDNAHVPRRVGCNDHVSNGATVVMHELPHWSPEITIEPIIDPSSTFTETDPLPFVTVTVVQPAITGSLYVQVFPTSPFTDTGAVTAPVELMASLGNDRYTATLELDDFAFEGYVRVWVAGTNQEEIVSYFFGGGWGPNRYGWGPNRYGWGPNRYGWGPNRYGWGVGRLGWNAPISSGNGQVTIFDIDHIFGDTPAYTLQSTTIPSDFPAWLTPVGEAYRVTVPEPLTSTTNILFSYLQRSVPNGSYEDAESMGVYFRPINGQTWTALDTSLDTDLNQASALFDQSGIYVLAMTVFVERLEVGWNLTYYPVRTTRPIADALASLDGSFTSIYKTDGNNLSLYDKTVDEAFRPIVNSLTRMEPSTYWIYATQPISWYLPVDVSSGRAQSTQDLGEHLPSTFYGEITSPVTIGDPVEATINGVLCGTGEVISLEQQLAYVVQVTSRGSVDCGITNSPVTFTVGDLPANEIGSWDNRQAQRLDLTISTPTSVSLGRLSAKIYSDILLLIMLLSVLLLVTARLPVKSST